MTHHREWAALYKTGAIAALLAAILFRRNIGAEVSLFTGVEGIPDSAAGWFSLLQAHPFTGLSFLAVFDLANYALEGVIFLALGAVLWQANKSLSALALASGLVGIAVSFSTNISFSMMAISQQNAAAATETQRAASLTAGEALLATNNPLAAFPSSGAFMAVLLIALAGLLLSVLLLPSHRATAVVGLLASGCDLAYCLTFPFSPILQAILMSCGGAGWMIWHIMVARVLFKRAAEKG